MIICGAYKCLSCMEVKICKLREGKKKTQNIRHSLNSSPSPPYENIKVACLAPIISIYQESHANRERKNLGVYLCLSMRKHNIH